MFWLENQTKFKILWPSLAAYALGIRSRTDLETGHSESAEMMAMLVPGHWASQWQATHEIQCSVSMPYIHVPG